MGACLSAQNAQGGGGEEEAVDLRLFPGGGKKLHPGRLQDVYRAGRTIGSGAFSKVHKLRHRQSKQQYACKVMPLPPPDAASAPDRALQRATLNELRAMLDLDHPNVMGMEEYFVQGGKVYLVMDLARGGPLLDVLNNDGRFSDADARTLFQQLIRGLQYLQSKGVVHRDIKMENLLLTQEGDLTGLKIADFGLARKAGPKADIHHMTWVCGTAHYVAPEVLSAGRHPQPDGTTQRSTYGPACDLWSAGVILYMLLGGHSPFSSSGSPASRAADIKEGRYSFDHPVWGLVAAEAKDLIRRLLVVDPARRLTCEQVLAHPWITCGTKQQQAAEVAVAADCSVRGTRRRVAPDAPEPEPEGSSSAARRAKGPHADAADADATPAPHDAGGFLAGSDA